MIDTLMDIAHKPNWRFSVFAAHWQGGRRSDAVIRWTNLLLHVANNDFAEGRTEAGLEELLRVLQLARHFHMQIDPWDRDAGRDILWAGEPPRDRESSSA